MAGMLDYSKFKRFAEEFVTVSSELGDTWCLKTSAHTKEVYMTKRQIVYNNTANESQLGDEICQDFCTYDYHIIYSHSYSVPVLYFNAYRSDGSLLKLEKLWDTIPEIFQKQINDLKWTTLTQQEHPILGVPYFTLHPCHTSEFMSSILSISGKDTNYFVPWLSTIGPLVGIILSPSIALKLVETNRQDTQG